MKQSEIFLHGEGAEWLKRNINKLNPKSDPVLEALKTYNIQPSNVLEVGCANGWRLDRLNEEYGCNVWGIEPGAQNNAHPISIGTADDLSNQFISEKFDLVIYAWCLYLCDPEDYFKIALEGDRVLQDEGFLIIYDFTEIFPHKTPYKHKEGIYSYHYDFAKLWLGNPAYKIHGRQFQVDTSVTILKKDTKKAFHG